jgi:hypothetical protein
MYQKIRIKKFCIKLVIETTSPLDCQPEEGQDVSY